MSDYQAIVVGAGFSGAVMAEQLASTLGWRVLVLEQRSHVAGNCYDEKSPEGITVHKYGPHLFHTNKSEVWHYLSRFTTWHSYQHKVLACVDDILLPLPFNLNSLRQIYSAEKALRLEDKLLTRYGAGNKISILRLRETDDPELRLLADWIYQNIFVNYTVRQWGISAEDIAPQVLERVPVVLSHDDRYFHDYYQAIPAKGYTELIKSLLNHPLITCELNQDALQRITLNNKQIFLDGKLFSGKMIYTGMLDALFGYSLGALPYRSLKFMFKTLDYPYHQNTTTINYPNAPDMTRITEFKHILNEKSNSTVVVVEYPQDYDHLDSSRNIPYYPVFTEENQRRYMQYKELCSQYPQLIVLGRLAEYKYFNMDDAVANALEISQKLHKIG